MADYGLTPTGLNLKRLDVILDEMHADLSERWGINTRQNPETLLNHILTNVADELAELWEYGAAIYYAHYPATAEGVSLDNATQYAGVIREAAARSIYYILCNGKDGTEIPVGTRIASSTNPPVELLNLNVGSINRGRFNQAEIKITALDNNPLRISVNANVYTYTPGNETNYEALNHLLGVMQNSGGLVDFDISVTESEQYGGIMTIKALDVTSSNVLILSSNMTTETVGCIVPFATVDFGDIYLPPGVINQIVTSSLSDNLLSVENVGSYIAGNDDETDTQLRQSYADKIYNISETMIDSIRSAILRNVQGVTAVTGYENVGDTVDAEGRYPHSVEMIVAGGDSAEIARWIYLKKAGGINTYGRNVRVPVSTSYGNEITIAFSRPIGKDIYFDVTYTVTDGTVFPEDYGEITQKIIASKVAELEIGEDLIPQKLLYSALFDAVPGTSYVDILMAEGKMTQYYILCTGEDGTELEVGTEIKSDTSPEIEFYNPDAGEITSSAFYSVTLAYEDSPQGDSVSITMNGKTLSASYSEATALDALKRLASNIRRALPTLSTKVDETDLTLTITSKELLDSSNTITALDNLEVTSVSSIIPFEMQTYQDIQLPEGSINIIVTSVEGLESVTNVGAPSSSAPEPEDYTLRIVKATARDRLQTTETMIAVSFEQ